MSDNENTNDTITPFICFPCTTDCYNSTAEECVRPRDPARANCNEFGFCCFPLTFVFDIISVVPRYVQYKCC